MKALDFLRPRFIGIIILKLTERRSGQLEGWEQPSRVQLNLCLSMAHSRGRLWDTIRYSIQNHSLFRIWNSKSALHTWLMIGNVNQSLWFSKGGQLIIQYRGHLGPRMRAVMGFWVWLQHAQSPCLSHCFESEHSLPTYSYSSYYRLYWLVLCVLHKKVYVHASFKGCFAQSSCILMQICCFHSTFSVHKFFGSGRILLQRWQILLHWRLPKDVWHQVCWLRAVCGGWSCHCLGQYIPPEMLCLR